MQQESNSNILHQWYLISNVSSFLYFYVQFKSDFFSLILQIKYQLSWYARLKNSNQKRKIIIKIKKCGFFSIFNKPVKGKIVASIGITLITIKKVCFTYPLIINKYIPV